MPYSKSVTDMSLTPFRYLSYTFWPPIYLLLQPYTTGDQVACLCYLYPFRVLEPNAQLFSQYMILVGLVCVFWILPISICYFVSVQSSPIYYIIFLPSPSKQRSFTIFILAHQFQPRVILLSLFFKSFVYSYYIIISVKFSNCSVQWSQIIGQENDPEERTIIIGQEKNLFILLFLFILHRLTIIS